MPAGQEKFVVISDLEGWGYSNTDIRGYIAALSILQVCIFPMIIIFINITVLIIRDVIL